MEIKDPVGELLEPLRRESRAPKSDLARLREIEKAGDPQALARALADFDRRTKRRGLEHVEGLDPKLVNRRAFQRATLETPSRALPAARPLPTSSLLVQLLEDLKCDCLVPFTWAGLNVFGSMTGPNRADVHQGILGANREYTEEYTVNNPGDTQGKGRIPINGQMHMTFEATVPRGGRWCLLMPAGDLWVRGRSKVVGQGNMTTSYDAKVWVDYYQLLIVGSALVEIAGGEIHYDGTRSEVRTTSFEADVVLSPRYLYFTANTGERVVLSLRVEVGAAANEDGVAVGSIDYFGFPANTKRDYDTVLIKA